MKDHIIISLAQNQTFAGQETVGNVNNVQHFNKIREINIYQTFHKESKGVFCLTQPRLKSFQYLGYHIST